MPRFDGVYVAAKTNETKMKKQKIVEIVKCVHGMAGTR